MIQWGCALQDDVADTMLWAQKEKGADGRTCIAGASDGGHGTRIGLVRQPVLCRC